MVKIYNLEFAQNLAISKGGECLSEEYKNCVTKMKWKCSQGHEWETKLSKIKNEGSWCPRCHFDKKMLSLDDAHKLAKEKGGVCLSEEYKGASSKLNWRCEKGHEWETTLGIVKNNGSWCRKCYDLSKRCDLQEAQTIALDKGGKCLSTEYVNRRTSMEWECERGHKWSAIYDSIKKGKWCPYCPFKSEESCRKIFKKIFREEFPKKRPKFLKMDGRPTLELDGYNEDLKIAFEYQGAQHYRHIPHFHKTEEEFEKLQERDILKYKLCQEEGINLILIPYNFTHKEEDEMEIYILDQIIAQGIKLNFSLIFEYE